MRRLFTVSHPNTLLRRRGQIQAILLAVFLLLASLLTLRNLAQLEWGYAAADVVGLGLLLGLFLLNYRGYIRVVGWLITAQLLGTMLLLVLTPSQINGPQYLGVAIPVILASLLVVPWAGFAVAVIVLAYPLVVYGLVPNLFVALLLLAVAGVSWINTRTLSQSVQETEAAARLLEQSNADLSAQAMARDALLATQATTLAAQEQLLQTVRQLSVPTIPVAQGVIALPIVGFVGQQRLTEIGEALLTAVHEQRSQVVILDLTGISGLTAATVTQLMLITRSVRLLGAQVAFSGLRAEQALLIVDAAEEVDILSHRNLEEALSWAQTFLRQRNAGGELRRAPARG